jgi:3D (Asp-Asp-Asp) domain-containing protein
MRGKKWIGVALVVVAAVAAVLLISLRSDTSDEEESASEPAQVEPIKGTDLSRVTLTADAAKRLGIRTAAVDGTVIPYGAVLYDPEGHTFTYTSPERLVFVRSPISVDHIDHGQAFLSRGPRSGTAVVTVGSQELFGTEYEVEED